MIKESMPSQYRNSNRSTASLCLDIDSLNQPSSIDSVSHFDDRLHLEDEMKIEGTEVMEFS